MKNFFVGSKDSRPVSKPQRMFPYRPRYYLKNPHEIFKGFWYHTKAGWQRYRRGWSYADVWNADHHLVHVIYGLVSGVRHNEVGAYSYPTSVEVDVFKKLTEAEEESIVNEWNRRLDLILEGCEAKMLLQDAPWDINDEDRAALNKAWETGMEMFASEFDGLWY